MFTVSVGLGYEHLWEAIFLPNLAWLYCESWRKWFSYSKREEDMIGADKWFTGDKEFTSGCGFCRLAGCLFVNWIWMLLGTTCTYLWAPHFPQFLIVLLCPASQNYLISLTSESICVCKVWFKVRFIGDKQSGWKWGTRHSSVYLVGEERSVIILAIPSHGDLKALENHPL